MSMLRELREEYSAMNWPWRILGALALAWYAVWSVAVVVTIVRAVLRP
jgi:hypothetical protein